MARRAHQCSDFRPARRQHVASHRCLWHGTDGDRLARALHQNLRSCLDAASDAVICGKGDASSFGHELAPTIQQIGCQPLRPVTLAMVSPTNIVYSTIRSLSAAHERRPPSVMISIIRAFFRLAFQRLTVSSILLLVATFLLYCLSRKSVGQYTLGQAKMPG